MCDIQRAESGKLLIRIDVRPLMAAWRSNSRLIAASSGARSSPPPAPEI
jgi:hypothetical protein